MTKYLSNFSLMSFGGNAKIIKSISQFTWELIWPFSLMKLEFKFTLLCIHPKRNLSRQPVDLMLHTLREIKKKKPVFSQMNEVQFIAAFTILKTIGKSRRSSYSNVQDACLREVTV